MKKFKSVSFGSLTFAAHYNFCAGVDKDLTGATPVILDALGQLPPQFNFWLKEEEYLGEWIRKDLLTKEIAEADKRMDKAFVAMKVEVNAKGYSNDANVIQSSWRVYNMLKSYGSVYKKSYEEQSGDVTLILKQLQTGGAYANDANILDLNNWTVELQRSYELFKNLLAQRDKKSLLKPDKTFREIRKGIESVYHQIVTIIDAGAALNVSPDFGDFIDKLNPEIERLNAEFHRVRINIKDAEPAPIPPQIYNGNPITPVPDVLYITSHDETITLVLGKDYNVTYKNNIEVGNAQCTIHGKGAYKGTKTVTFIIERAS